MNFFVKNSMFKLLMIIFLNQTRRLFIIYYIIKSIGILVSATPIIEAKKNDESRDRTQEDNFVSSAVRRATASSRKVRLYQTDELENLYRELTNQRLN